VQTLGSIYREQGIAGVARRLGGSLITSVCDYQVQEIRGRSIAEQDAAWKPRENETKLALECRIIEPGGSLEPLRAEFALPLRDSFDSLKARLDQGCTLILARARKKDETGKEIAAYSILERGGFSAAGIKGRISERVLFIHHTEVAREYRGQRIAQELTSIMKEYCRSRGIGASCTAHRIGNIPSQRAFGRITSSRFLCHAVRVSLFRGLFVWHTPWRKIESAIASLDEVEGEVKVEGKAEVKAEV
jgi:GNAT superfamily N-acetyltransferase